jgi:ribosome modulation factor
MARRPSAAQIREDAGRRRREDGHVAALNGASADDCPYELVSWRSDWLYGWWAGQRELKYLADAAVRTAAFRHPAAWAALAYAEAARAADRDGHEAMAEAARQLIDEIAASNAETEG